MESPRCNSLAAMYFNRPAGRAVECVFTVLRDAMLCATIINPANLFSSNDRSAEYRIAWRAEYFAEAARVAVFAAIFIAQLFGALNQCGYSI